MQTPYWNNQLFKTQALAAWNLQQPAWTKIKRYEELTPAEQSIVDGCADELEYAALIESTAESVRKVDC